MRPLGVIIAPPCFDDDLCLGESVEDFTVEEFIAKLRVEALAIASRGPAGDSPTVQPVDRSDASISSANTI